MLFSTLRSHRAPRARIRLHLPATTQGTRKQPRGIQCSRQSSPLARARANHHSRWIRVRHIWASKTRRCARRLGPLNLVGGVALLLRIRFLSRRISTLLVCPDCVTIGGCVAAQCVALPYILGTNLRFLFRPQAPRASELQTSPHDSPSPPFLTTSSHRRASEMTPTTFPPARGTLYAPEAPHYSLPALMAKRAWLANRILEMAIIRHPTATNPKG